MMMMSAAFADSVDVAGHVGAFQAPTRSFITPGQLTAPATSLTTTSSVDQHTIRAFSKPLKAYP